MTIKQEYTRARKNLRAQMISMERRGYTTPDTPKIPKRITRASVRALKAFQSKLYERSTFTTWKGETLEGKKGRAYERKESAQKAVRTRIERKKRRDDTYEPIERISIERARERTAEENAERQRQAEAREYYARRDAERKEKAKDRESERKLYEQGKTDAKSYVDRLVQEGVVPEWLRSSTLANEWLDNLVTSIEVSGHGVSAMLVTEVYNNELDKLTEENYKILLDDTGKSEGELTPAESRHLRETAEQYARDSLGKAIAGAGSHARRIMDNIEQSAYNPSGNKFQSGIMELKQILSGRTMSAQERQAFSQKINEILQEEENVTDEMYGDEQ